MTYRRWYDADPKVGEVVHAMEFLNRDTQLHFAGKLLELSQGLLAEQGGDDYLESLDDRKKEGLSKSYAKKRWYDRHETLHRAFNYLYALPSAERREIATKLATPIQIVEGYEKHCGRQGKPPESKVIEEILRSCFLEGHQRAKKLYSLYLYDFSAIQENTAVKAGSVQSEDSSGLWSGLLKKLQESLV